MAVKKSAPASEAVVDAAPVEFAFDPEKHIRIGDKAYDKESLDETCTAEIGFVHWIDQQIANKNAELKVIQDGRDVAIERLLKGLEEHEALAEMTPPTAPAPTAE
jgi:hypothetical protein